MTDKSGWEREHRVHFDDIVEEYDKVRGEYPQALYQDIFNYASSGKNAIEIGAGTGKATAPFLMAGYHITAVEIGKNMVDYLTHKFAGNKQLTLINDSFENAIFDEDCFDIVYAATAFHWVDAAIGCPKVFKLLKKGGTFALFRYNTRPSVGDALYDEIQSYYKKYYNTYYVKNKKPIRKTHDDFLMPSEIYRGFRFNCMEQYGFSNATMKFYDGTINHSASDYITLLNTYSDHRALPEENRKTYMKVYMKRL